MELIKVMKSGALHFKLSDGRIGATYPSGYVRVSTFGIGHYSKRIKMYQINKQLIEKKLRLHYDGSYYVQEYVERIRIPNCSDRIKHLLEFNNKNCK